MNKKLLALIVALIIVISAVAAIQLSTKPAPSTDARKVKIGLVAPMSTSIGQDMANAAEMAVQEINDAGVYTYLAGILKSTLH